VNNEINILQQYKKKMNSQITREEYWGSFRNFLLNMSSFMELQDSFGNLFSYEGKNIIVNLKSTETHSSRIRMKLDPNDIRSVPFSVLADGFYEPYQSDLLVSLGKLSNHFLDIGSNMGFYSLALARENPHLSVDAFEPQPLVFSTLRENVILNNLVDRITVHNLGLGNGVASLTMYVPKFTGSGGASFQNLHVDEGEATEIVVQVKILDQVISANLDLLKIDVEGSELNVLYGAKSIISKTKPTVVVELLRKWMKPFGHSPQMFLEEMKDFGYLCFAIGADKLTPVDVIDESTQQTNFIFVHPEQTTHLNLLRTEIAS